MYDRKCGYIYLIEFDHGVKIGRARNPKRRLDALQTQSGKKCINLFISEHLSDYAKSERELHKHFKYARGIGEYFNEKFDVILDKYNEMKFNLAVEMTIEEIREDDLRFEKTIAPFKTEFATREEIHQEYVKELDKWIPTKHEIEFVKKDVLEWYKAEKEEGMIEESEDTLKLYNSICASDGVEQRNLMQNHLIFISNCTPREVLSKEFNRISDRARGKETEYLRVT